MARKTRGRPRGAKKERPYPELREHLLPIWDAYRHLQDDVSQREVAEELGLDPAAFSKYLNGWSAPVPEASLRIARKFDIPLEEMLAWAKHPVVKNLLETVENYAGELVNRKRIIAMLKSAQLPRWRELSWRSSGFKDSAELILASTQDDIMKAVAYAGQVYKWGEILLTGKPEVPIEAWKTDEIAAVIASPPVVLS